MNDLFAAMPKAETAMAAGEKTAERTEPRHESLAERMRPKRFEDVVGQDALLAPSSPVPTADRRRPHRGHDPLRSARDEQDDDCPNRRCGDRTRFRSVDGTKTKAEELRTVAREARSERQLLFVDEFHRVTIPRQEEFLSMIEDGSIQLIAATTGNPYHDVAPASSRERRCSGSLHSRRARQTLLYERTRDRVRDDDGIVVEDDAATVGEFVRRPAETAAAGHRLREPDGRTGARQTDRADRRARRRELRSGSSKPRQKAATSTTTSLRFIKSMRGQTRTRRCSGSPG